MYSVGKIDFIEVVCVTDICGEDHTHRWANHSAGVKKWNLDASEAVFILLDLMYNHMRAYVLTVSIAS
jgi:hypothetical protein